MAKFRPSLLDTLLAGARPPEDSAPDQADNAVFPGIRLYSLDRMSEASFLDTLRRDLSWLMNTVRLEETMPLTGAPEVARSVLNYGIPDFSVRTFSSVDVQEASGAITKAIDTFEPRIDKKTLAVRGEKRSRRNSVQSLTFHIHCQVGYTDDPLHAGFKTQIDVETGEAKLEEGR